MSQRCTLVAQKGKCGALSLKTSKIRLYGTLRNPMKL